MNSVNPIKAIREVLHKTQNEMAGDLGLPMRTYQDNEKLGEIRNPDALKRLYTKFRVNLHYVIGASTQMFVHDEVTAKPTEGEDAGNSEEFYYLPFYDVKASAGYGLIGTDKDPLPMAFRKYWVNSVLGVNYSDLFLMKAEGDSMYPTLQTGDMILVNRAQKETTLDAIYVVRLDDLYKVKRIQRLPGNKIEFSSDNRSFDSFVAELGRDDIEIVGRVVWFSRSL